MDHITKLTNNPQPRQCECISVLLVSKRFSAYKDIMAQNALQISKFAIQLRG